MRQLTLCTTPYLALVVIVCVMCNGSAGGSATSYRTSPSPPFPCNAVRIVPSAYLGNPVSEFDERLLASSKTGVGLLVHWVRGGVKWNRHARRLVSKRHEERMRSCCQGHMWRADLAEWYGFVSKFAKVVLSWSLCLVGVPGIPTLSPAA